MCCSPHLYCKFSLVPFLRVLYLFTFSSMMLMVMPLYPSPGRPRELLCFLNKNEGLMIYKLKFPLLRHEKYQ
jgi:hypothetical protein